MILKRLGIGFLRLLIVVGFTFSLVAGAVLTMLTLFNGTGNNLVWSRTGLDWGMKKGRGLRRAPFIVY